MTNRDELRARRLSRLLDRCERGWRAGSLPALAEVVIICEGSSLPLPGWATRGVLDTISEQFAGSADRRRGRTARRCEAYRQDMVHYTRWDAVKELRDRREDLSDIIPPTWEEAYSKAASILERTDAAGSEDTMKRSYQLVEREMQRQPGRFFEAYLWRPPSRR